VDIKGGGRLATPF